MLTRPFGMRLERWLPASRQPLFGSLPIDSMPGIWIDSQLTRNMPEKSVRALLCPALVTAGLKVIN